MSFASEKWTDQDVKMLHHCKRMGWPMQDICVLLKRSAKSIREKWKKLTESQEQYEERTGRNRLKRQIEKILDREEERADKWKVRDAKFQEAFLRAHPDRRYESIQVRGGSCVTTKS